MNPEPALRADGLTKAFGGEPVLDDVDLELAAGETTLLMGPNGEGKTVLLCCLAGGLRPTAGRALVHGRPAGEAADRVSLLLQDSVGLPALTGPETARFYADLHPASSGRWARLLARFDMTDDGTILKHCSGGMRRKVELAVALDPAVPVYLLDEPTAALDLGALHVLHRVLRERREEGRTVVLTSHSPLDVQLADRLVFVDGGGVTHHGRPGSLLAALPPVVRLRGAIHEAATAIRPHLRAGHRYGSGPELRGFLRADSSVDRVADDVSDLGVVVDRDDPTAVDLYEYLSAVDGR
ncbi:MAG: ATP-binding cassette domain-containing protein [Halobacteriales archaeon]